MAEMEESKNEEEWPEEEKDVTFEGMEIIGSMSSKDVKELIERVDQQIPAADRKKAKQREKLIRWENVAFGSLSANDCRMAWNYLMTNARTYRLMSEITAELRNAMKNSSNRLQFFASCKQCPRKPAKARGGVYVYMSEKWEKHLALCAEKKKKISHYFVFNNASAKQYAKLSAEEKEKYKKESKIYAKEYEDKLETFCTRFPKLSEKLKFQRRKFYHPKVDPPKKYGFKDAPIAPISAQAYYVQGKVERLESPPPESEIGALKAKYLKKYHKLSDERKAKWIDYTINCCELYEPEVKAYCQQYPDYNPPALKMKTIVKKPELQIWEKFKDRPVTPPNTVYALFVQNFLQMEENTHLSESEARDLAHTAFQELDWHTREQYKIDFKMVMKNYRQDIREYYEKLPNVIKPLILSTIAKRYHSYLIHVDKLPPSALIQQEDENVEQNNTSNSVNKESDFIDVPQEDEEQNDTASNFVDASQTTENQSKKRKTEDDVQTEEVFNGDIEGQDENSIKIETEVINVETASSQKKSRRSSVDSTETVAFPDRSQNVILSEETPESDSRIEGLDEITDEIIEEERIMATKKTLKAIKKLKPDRVEKPVVLSQTMRVEDKPSIKDIIKSKVNQRDINDTIRGIFDGRSHLGRKYSVYYFYAKYVAQDPAWITCMNTYGILNTADKIVETFVGLKDSQKQIFIEQSYNFFLQKQHGINVNGTKNPYAPEEALRLFPGEPQAPPRTATKLYYKEVETLKRKSLGVDFPKWEKLHTDTQMLFVKKLYQETQLYIKKYEDFIMQMTSNDLVEYTVFRARIWENNYLHRHAATSAVKGFIFPLPYNEYKDDWVDSEPEEIPNTRSVTAAVNHKEWRKKVNPFAVHKICPVPSKVEKVAKKSTGLNDPNQEYYSSEDELINRPKKKLPADIRLPKVRDSVKAFFEPMGLIGKPKDDILYRRASKRELCMRKKAADAMAANEKKMQEKIKNQSKKIRKARILYGARYPGKKLKKKAKVLKPNRQNTINDDIEDEDLSETENAYRQQNAKPRRNVSRKSNEAGEENQENDPQNEKEVDCSDFLLSLRGSPSKENKMEIEEDEYDFDTSQLAASGVPDLDIDTISAYQEWGPDAEMLAIEDGSEFAVVNEADIIHDMEVAGESFFLESEPFDIRELQTD